jgi:2-amino-4-hydroxy-6-hydroxymethyldihydropteridine diphosphokinase
MKQLAILLIGSNSGDRLSYLDKAKQHLIAEFGIPDNVSSIYETSAWGITDQAPFLNQVVGVFPTEDANLTLKKLLQIEEALGRKRSEKWGPRIIDIDLLYYGETISTNLECMVPHPEIQNRRFTLTPLAEIYADFIHPIFKINQEQLLNKCTDSGTVSKLNTIEK